MLLASKFAKKQKVVQFLSKLVGRCLMGPWRPVEKLGLKYKPRLVLSIFWCQALILGSFEFFPSKVVSSFIVLSHSPLQVEIFVGLLQFGLKMYVGFSKP